MRAIFLMVAILALPACVTVNLAPPGPTPTPTCPPAEVAYLREFGPLAGEINQRMGAISRLLAEPNKDTGMWRLTFANETAALRDTRDRIAKLTPPPRLADYHRYTLTATDAAVSSDETFIRALETRDQRLFDDAAQKAGIAGEGFQWLSARAGTLAC